MLVLGRRLAAAGANAVAIAADMTLRGYRRRMWIMHLVYPVTALYWLQPPRGSTSVMVGAPPVQ